MPYRRISQRVISEPTDEAADSADARPSGGDAAPAEHVVDGKRVRLRSDGTITVFDVARPLGDTTTSSPRHDGGLVVGWSDPEQRQPVALVVDDEPAVGSIIGRLLTRYGWQAIVVADAENALSRFERDDVDLLVTDFELPGISGLGLARLLRERDPSLPIIVVSGWPDAAALVEDGRTAFVPKPIDFDEFMSQVRTLAS